MPIPSDHDLLLAGQVQRGIMPRVPEIPGYEFFAHYQPVYPVGGDYYDFVRLPGDRLAIVVGDVAGKGIPAAMLMAQFAAETRHHVRLADALEAAAAALNGQLHEYALEELFVTLCLGVLELGPRRFSYCSAGHPPPLIRRADGRIEEPGTDGCGVPLGILPDAEYRHVSLHLDPGDAVLLFSDGVTDALSTRGERYHLAEDSRLRRPLEPDRRQPEGDRMRDHPGPGGVFGGTGPVRRHHPDLLRPGGLALTAAGPAPPPGEPD